MTNPDCRFLTWDTEFFGKRIARVTAEDLSHKRMQEILRWCGRERVDCLYYLCPARDLKAIRIAERNRFRLVDLRAELEINPLASPRGESLVSRSRTRESTPADLGELMALSGSAFLNTRFANDPGFGPDQASRLYQQWISQNCENPDAHVLVSTLGTRITGFVSFEVHSDLTATIGLIAVQDGMRGQGVGRVLTEACIEHCRQACINKLTVVTQGANTPALRLYERCGFRLATLKLWYHKWFKPYPATKTLADVQNQTVPNSDPQLALSD